MEVIYWIVVFWLCSYLLIVINLGSRGKKFNGPKHALFTFLVSPSYILFLVYYVLKSLMKTK